MVLTPTEVAAFARRCRAMFARAMTAPRRRTRYLLRGRWMKLQGELRYDAPNRKWRIKAEPHILLRLKRVFERISKNQFGGVSLSDTIENARELEWFLTRYALFVSDTDRALLTARAAAHREREAQIEAVLGPGYAPPAFDLALPLREYQRTAADLLLRSGRLLLADDVGLGKAQPLTAKVLTPTGWRAMGDLVVGDEVVDPDGGAARVDAIYPQGERDVFRVVTADGAATECCDDHLWLLYTTNDRNRGTDRVLALREFRDDLQRRSGPNSVNRYFVPLMQPARFAPPAPLPLHPYLLGALIGDGCMSEAKGGLTFTQVESEVLSRVEACLPAGVRLRRCAEDDITWRLRREAISGPHPVIAALRALGLYGCLSPEKWVPAMYMHADVEARVELLRGLMDTDGDCTSGGTAVFSTSSSRLLANVVELVGGLGGFASTYTKLRPTYVHKGETRVGLPAYRANIRLPFNPFALKRKADRWHLPYMARAITRVDAVGRAPVQCIKVSSKRQLYVTDGFIVTHNTASAIGPLCDPRALPALVVTLTHLPKQWEGELARFAPKLRTHVVKSGKPYDLTRGGKDPHPDVTIMNYHKLHGWADALAGKMRYVVFDECQELRKGLDSLKGVAAKHLASQAAFRLGTSATPFYNHGVEMFSVLDCLAPGEVGSDKEFAREWCGANEWGDRSKIKDPKAFGTYLRAQGLMLRRTRAEVGREIPPVSKIPHYIDADLDVLHQQEGAAIELAKIILTQAGLERGAKLRAAEELSWRLRMATGIAKAPFVAAFVRLLVESGERVLLYGWHKDVYAIWEDKLKDLRPAKYTGAESTAQKDAAKAAFVSGEAQVLMMSLRAGAGLDGLQQVCRTVVIGELDWSPGVLEQCVGRIARDGQADPVMAYYLYANHGADPVMLDVLGVKRSQIEGVRDPNAALIETLDVSEDNIKRLAAAYLQQRGVAFAAGAA